jgi:two-component system, LytTR family, sensor histidine kinase AlgZ
VQLARTLKALAAPRRALPIAAVLLALVGVELYYGDARTALVPLGMSLAFVALAPWTWQRAPWLLVPEAAIVIAVFGIALPRALGVGHTYFTDPGSLVIAGVVYCVGGWGLGRDIALEHDLEHVRLKAIKAHLDPHFLYNTLNAIAEWCAEDPKVAEEATVRLADMLRAMLEGLERTSWPLDREITLARDLLELHRLRDADAFTVRVEAEDVTIEVPPLVLVSIVENAIKHGPRAGHRGEIAIRVTATPRGVRCTVTNPGTFAPAQTGRGLALLEKRVALHGNARFTIAADGDATRAVLELVR